jgi:hypothetical protein
MRAAGIRYTPTDAIETFSFPYEDRSVSEIGESVYNARKRVMRERKEGLTKLYNRINDPDEAAKDIRDLRTLHVELDRAVAAAYGWFDLEMGHGFNEAKQGIRYTISEAARREVLDRLLALNHQRYAEEEEERYAQPAHQITKRGRKKQDARDLTLLEL